jgi:translation elongation factor EF-1beta
MSVLVPLPNSVKIPLNEADELNAYVPGDKIIPAKSPVRTVGFGIAAMTLYAVLASATGPVADVKAEPV